MALHTLMAFATILSIITVSESAQKEQNKPGPLYTLCGNDFTLAFDDCCRLGYPACANIVTSSEGGVEVLDKRGHPLIPSRVAKNFMGALRKREWGEDNSGGNIPNHAVEECCNEGCSIAEILEYPCW